VPSSWWPKCADLPTTAFSGNASILAYWNGGKKTAHGMTIQTTLPVLGIGRLLATRTYPSVDLLVLPVDMSFAVWVYVDVQIHRVTTDRAIFGVVLMCPR